MFYNGVWGSLCEDDNWDLKDGHVVCRMLGYEYALQISSGRKYVKTKSYIVLTSLKCRGSESDIMNCPHQRNLICRNNDGAGVVCYRPFISKGNKKA